MAAFTDYKGVTVVESATEAGGQNLTDNFKYLADTVIMGTFNARLTLEMGAPISTTDQTGGTLYLTPYRGSK